MTETRPERRLAERFALELDVSYEVLNKDYAAAVGKATTRNISRTGVLFDAGRRRSKGALSIPGSIARLAIDWPVRYEDSIPIELHIIGKVIRSDQQGTAIKILRHGFTRLEPDRPHSAPIEEDYENSA